MWDFIRGGIKSFVEALMLLVVKGWK